MVQKVLGLLLMLFSLTLLPALGVSLLYDDGGWRPFSYSFAFTLLAGLVLWFPVRLQERELRLRDGFLVVASFWVVLGLFGALPFYLSDATEMDVTDAIFESMSGLTTTGATV
ncbi:MAG: potassium transporter TrkG, partial [Pseudomonadota bacterium]